jgi:mannose-6-phosphate isomerase-like protein (cupin superfamily)
MRTLLMMLCAIRAGLFAQETKVEPSWLYRNVSALAEHPVDLSTESCRYTPIFGEGDVESRFPLSVARFGELKVAASGSCRTVEYQNEEELLFVMSGEGTLRYGAEARSLAANDFTYVPPTVRHSLATRSHQPLHILLITVRIPQETPIAAPNKLEMANLADLKEQTVGGHPSSVQYKLLIGPRTASRDRINSAYMVVDFFLMDFLPGGTNLPHHHETAEEIYLVLDGEGQMAAGSGMDGIEGLRPAKAGDAYYFRPNCTVGFYNQKTGTDRAHILAVRATVPMPKNPD